MGTIPRRLTAALAGILALWLLAGARAQAQAVASPVRLTFLSSTQLLVSDSRRQAIVLLDAQTLAAQALLKTGGKPVSVAWGDGRLFVGDEARSAVEVYRLTMGRSTRGGGEDEEDDDRYRKMRREERRKDRHRAETSRSQPEDERYRHRHRARHDRRDDERNEEYGDDRDEDDHDGGDEDDHGGQRSGLTLLKQYDLGGGAGSVGRPMDIAVDEAAGLVFVVDGATRDVKVFRTAGALVRVLPDAAAPPLFQPTGVAVDPLRHEVLVSDFGEPTAFSMDAYVRIYGYDGSYRGAIPGAGAPEYRFSRPQGLAVADAGRILVTDSLLGQVLVFDRAALQGLGRIGSAGTAPGQLLLPLDVALHPTDGSVYVTNNRNARLEVFPAGTW